MTIKLSPPGEGFQSGKMLLGFSQFNSEWLGFSYASTHSSSFLPASTAQDRRWWLHKRRFPFLCRKFNVTSPSFRLVIPGYCGQLETEPIQKASLSHIWNWLIKISSFWKMTSLFSDENFIVPIFLHIISFVWMT